MAADRSSEPIIAYTDGACSGNPGPAGIGVVLLAGRHRKELTGYLGRATNNVAELAAMLVALRAVRDPSRVVRLYTDSGYARGLLTLGWKAKANRALVEALRAEAARFDRLEVIQVPGHAGVPENERADQLARDAISLRGPAVDLHALLSVRGDR